MLYIPAVNYIFLHGFNKTYPGWLNAGAHCSTWGRVSQYVPGAAISPSPKGGTTASTLVSPLRATVSALLTGHMQWFLPKQIMMSLEHHVVMSQWCEGFQMMTFKSVLKGYKRRMHKRVGVPVSSSQVPGFKFRAQVNLLQSTSVHPHTVLARNFYTKATILFLVPCFIMVICTGLWFLSTFLVWMATKLMYPATLKKYPTTRTAILYQCWWKLADMDQEYLISPCTVIYIVKLYYTSQYLNLI